MPDMLDTQLTARRLDEVFQSIIDHAGAKTVYGEPVSVGGRTILPVATIRYGFGGGSGVKASPEQRGGGGGGGLIAKPLGVVEVTESTTRFIPIHSSWPIAAAVGLGLCLGLLVAPKRVDVHVDKPRRH